MEMDLRLEMETVVELVSRTVITLKEGGWLHGDPSALTARVAGAILNDLNIAGRLGIGDGQRVALSPSASPPEPPPPRQTLRPHPSQPLQPGPRIIMNVEDSITDDLIYCLFDDVGRKMITRHILGKYNMTWEQYLDYCGLPADYPRVAPSHSEAVSRSMVKSLNPDQDDYLADINRERARQSKKRRLEKQPSAGLVSKNQHKKPKLHVASDNEA
jgi:hypothetical protein